MIRLFALLALLVPGGAIAPSVASAQPIPGAGCPRNASPCPVTPPGGTAQTLATLNQWWVTNLLPAWLAYTSPSSVGSEANPFTYSDNTAGIQTQINALEGTGSPPNGRGGMVQLTANKYSTSTSIIINSHGVNLGCPTATYNGDANVVHGSSPPTWGCTIYPSVALTSGVLQYQIASGISGPITSVNGNNLSIWGVNTAGNDGSIGINATAHLNVTTWDHVNIGNVGYGYYFGVNGDGISCDTCNMTFGNLTADDWGIFVAKGGGIPDMHIIGEDISDNGYEGIADFGGQTTLATWILSGGDLNRDANTLTSYTASIATATTGTGSGTGSGTNLTLTGVTGYIAPGSAASAAITGTGVPGSTYIVSQTSGTTGGNGVYVTNNATTSSANTITVTGAVMTVSALAGGYIAPGKYVNGTGVTASTHVIAQATGTNGGVGTYVLDKTQTIASRAMTSPSANIYAGSPCMIVGSDIIGAGIHWPDLANVTADGVLLAGTKCLVSGNTIRNNTNGNGVRVTGASNVITNNFINGSGVNDVLFDSPSSGNVLFSPSATTFSDLGTNNAAIYYNTGLSWEIYGPANPTMIVKASPSALFGASVTLDATALSNGGQQWQLLAGGAGNNGNFKIVDITNSAVVALSITATTDVVNMNHGALVAGSGLVAGSATGGDKGVGTINAAAAYYSNGTIGVTCAGSPTASFASTLGIVTHC